MPRGDRTGPGGRGAMTGRGMGWCAGNNGPGRGRGGGGFGVRGNRGWGRGQGAGPGAWGGPNWAASDQPNASVTEPSLTELRGQAEELARVLGDLQGRIQTLETSRDE